ncbi:hypothetical protein V6N12_035437 [Hibiscus sabdariffa]|uniref:Uncharacterized protein n=1 Tax=Hibiscus sabdariffa TaxID=183260 RepID=A0ABR2EMQ7_9ROSI
MKNDLRLEAFLMHDSSGCQAAMHGFYSCFFSFIHIERSRDFYVTSGGQSLVRATPIVRSWRSSEMLSHHSRDMTLEYVR